LLLLESQIQADLDRRKQAGLVYGPTSSAGFTLTFLQKVYDAVGAPIPPMRHGQIVARDYTPKERDDQAAARRLEAQDVAERVEALVGRYGKVVDYAASARLDKANGLADSGYYVVIAATASDFVDGDPAIAKTRAEQKARPDSLESRLEKAGTTPFVLDLH